MKQVLTRKIVRELLRYEPKTGRLYWKRRSRKWFSSDRAQRVWNSRYAGKRAFTARSKHHNPHNFGTILRRVCYAHQIIWLMKCGYWPVGIDHRDGRENNNRWKNLREATKRVNGRNARRRRDSLRRYSNIEKRSNGTYRVFLRGTGYHGTFYSLRSALQARELIKKRYGYTKRHGAVS